MFQLLSHIDARYLQSKLARRSSQPGATNDAHVTIPFRYPTLTADASSTITSVPYLALVVAVRTVHAGRFHVAVGLC